jgi:hypothetical protein
MRPRTAEELEIFTPSNVVMAGLGPASTCLDRGTKKGVDHRDEPGDDD